ncbi:MalM family protein [Vibrio fluvialis]|uniref:MalM family protein n=5 Tax=Vibrio fluvialis TaxID=676 RepID=UPI001C9CB619|nr:MalM family protein [Vibrio fluvialis]MBY7936648.1 transcriptional regulator [Vibrio fluvialis]MCR9297506.1 MalM family protein [Vibrio fluvialis]
MKKMWVLALSVASLIGCTSSNEPNSYVDLALNQTDVCCESLSGAPWVALELSEDLNFGLDASSPVWQFDSGKSYFAAFQFADRSGNVDVRIRSVMQEGRVLKPAVQLLDTSFNVVRTISSDQFKTLFSDALSRNRFEIELSVNAKQTPYLVIYSETNALGEKVTIPHPAKLRAQQSGDPLPIVTDPTYEISSNGQLELNVETKTMVGGFAAAHLKSSVQIQPVTVQPDTKAYYFSTIEKAVEANDIPKALSLLDEAKALGIEGAQEVFVKAVNRKSAQ